LRKGDWLLAGVMSVVAYAVGMLYNMYCVRALFNRKSHNRITLNIKKRLLCMGRTVPITPQQEQALLSGNALMNTFYSLVDSQESLKEKAKLVRENGLAWSSIADIVVLGTLVACFYFPLWLLTNYSPFLYWAAIAVVLALLSAFVLHPRAERRHIALSNEQLDFIKTQMKSEVEQKVNAL
jgi:Flp pilus assembly protein TadB